MYEAPITIIEQAVQHFVKEKNEKIESHILQVCECYGIAVDKEELIKALNHDREQYDKGYNDGIKTLADRLKMQSVLCVDELYITIEESELDELVKGLTGEQHDKSKKENAD